MKLYYSPGACALHVQIALREVGAKFDLERVDLKTHTFSGGDFKKINPKGYIPVLQTEDGEIYTEGAIIVQRLADQFPEKKLLPKSGTRERYHAMEWLHFIATELHKGIGALFNPALDGEAKIKVIDKINVRLSYLNNHLMKNTYVLGSEFSLVDSYMFNIMRWAAPLKIDMSPYPKILGLMEKVGTRQSAREAIAAEGLKG